ncbi:hypothetical protein [Rubricoccus marinus]|nr:hypothetical protein [Rubricoccus marinus]
MTIRKTLAAACAAVPAFLTFAVYTARLSDFQLDLSSDDLDGQLLARNDD